MIPQPGQILLQRGKQWLWFSQPWQIITARRSEEVLPALQALEAAVNNRHLYAAGFLSYEAAPAFDSALQVAPADEQFPLLWFGLYQAPQRLRLPVSHLSLPPLVWKISQEEAAYRAHFEAVKNAIASGYTYQVNYTLRFQASLPPDLPPETFAWHFFLQLVRRQKGYAAFVHTGEHLLCSASPELFFEKQGEKITSRPMKGTAPRGRSGAEDQRQAENLRLDPKNRAENVMIVDMIRNDLGRIARLGSVQVPALFQLEKYSSVWQMTSTVQAETQASITQIFQALFPCASITGAPKVSSMRLIAQEEAAPRRVYTGSIGFWGPQGEAQFNVAIRSLVLEKKSARLEYGAGGGLVWDSQAESEYAEAKLKAQVLQQEYPAFHLLETLRWTPAEGYFLLAGHLERMKNSAAYFDYPFSAPKAQAALEKACAGAGQPLRVRLTLSARGRFEAQSAPLNLETPPWQACLAATPVSSREPFLYHKTTFRGFYPSAPPACAQAQTLLFFNENRQLTEFSLGNLVMEKEGQKFTPPLSCGLLPGVFRQYLLETGQVQERVLPLQDLEGGPRLFLVNAVRGWVPVCLE